MIKSNQMNDLKHLFKLIRFKNLMIIVSIQLLIKFCIVNQFVDNYSLDWIEFRDLKNGGDAFKQIHDGTCVAPKIILIP